MLALRTMINLKTFRQSTHLAQRKNALATTVLTPTILRRPLSVPLTTYHRVPMVLLLLNHFLATFTNVPNDSTSNNDRH